MFNFFKKNWFRFARVLGRINSYIILALIYFIVVGLYAAVSRLLGLFKAKKVSRVSGWESYPSQPRDLKKLEQEF